jgi:superfamily II DNA or RNA helicase
MFVSVALSKFFHARVRERGAELHRFRSVELISGGPFDATAIVTGSMRYHVTLHREGDEVISHCECPYFESEGLCKHIWATLLEADRKNCLAGAEYRPPAVIVEDWLYGLTPQRGGPPVAKSEWESAFAQVKILSPGQGKHETWRSDREIYYVIDRAQTVSGAGVYLEVLHRELRKNGGWGKLKGTRLPRQVIPYIPDAADREALALLAGVPDPSSYYNQDTVPYAYRLRHTFLHFVLPIICATGRCRLRDNALAPFERQTPLAWDGGEPWRLQLAVSRENDHWIVTGEFQRPDESMPVTEPLVISADGVLIARDLIFRFDAATSFAWASLLRRQQKVQVPLAEGGQLVRKFLEQEALPRIAWPEELHFDEIQVAPMPRAQIRERRDPWGKTGFACYLSFDYQGVLVRDDDPSAGVFQPDERRYIRRDRAAEDAAHDLLGRLGLRAFVAEWDEQSGREITAKQIPQVVNELLKAGWHVEVEGKPFRRASGVKAEVTSGIDWFELHAIVDFGSAQAGLPELLKAIRHGDRMVQLSDGGYGLIPDELLEQYGLLMAAGKQEGDHVRFSRAQTGLLDALLATREEVKTDEIFERARQQLRAFDRIEPAPQPPGFQGQLRGYQLEGLAWMQFLERIGFGGCLADDMGVGKTPQVLALLETRREQRAAGEISEPSLAVVPRSLIYNWKQEAARFTPELRVLDHSGAGRSKDVSEFVNYDLVLTTYGTLRRDAALHRDRRFDYVILDEAQAIKNPDSESAKAARLLNAGHRIAMSGTPIENHLGELWSLFEFLNPGMLGSISSMSLAGRMMRNPDEATRAVLSRVVRPFILRRTKDQVAPELPKKLEQTIYCELEKDQRKLYNQLRDHYRMSLLGQVERKGIAKSKLQILEALLRLRQAACHPGLLDPARVKDSSAKLEALLPQLREVMEEGHKALLFSQFTSLLSIVRGHLDEENIVYEYLDGRTKDRQARVERFQTDPDCKLFLISLKAGGVGLNLTAAEYVFLLDPWWNPAVEAQAIDRTHRIGQEHPVFAYRLIARNTVEEKVVELQNTKRNLADAIIRADTTLVRNLQKEDLDFLFS